MKALLSFLFLCSGCSAVIAGSARLDVIPAFSRHEQIYADVREILVGKGEFYWMIVMPSFAPEYSVALRSRADSTGSDPKLYVEVARAKSRAVSFDLEATQPGLACDRDVDVVRTQKGIGASDVNLLARASFGILSRVGVPEHGAEGLDGTIFLFCFDGQSGKTWSPSTGEPVAFTEVWSALADFVEATTLEGEAAALVRFRGACARIRECTDSKEVRAEPGEKAAQPGATDNPDDAQRI